MGDRWPGQGKALELVLHRQKVPTCGFLGKGFQGVPRWGGFTTRARVEADK